MDLISDHVPRRLLRDLEIQWKPHLAGEREFDATVGAQRAPD